MTGEYVEAHLKNGDSVKKYKLDPDGQYMLTIARDGEYPERSVYMYADSLNAVNGYNEYKDWGFAKHFLTVSLYEPSGKVHTKVLRRPPAGECVFVRQQYYDAEEIILKVKEKMDKESYEVLVKDFAKLFSIDSWRFDPVRFFEATKCDGEVIE
jgi:hypothetical protein